MQQALWWDSVQAKRKNKNKSVIKTLDRMIANMRIKLFPKDYQLSLYRHMQNLRQSSLTIREYTEEFYRVNLRAGYNEDTSKNTSRYINGFRMNIQYYISMLSPSTMEGDYQYALREEEKIARKKTFGRGRGYTKGKGQTTGREKGPTYKDEVGCSNQQYQTGKGDETQFGRSYHRGRGRGKESLYQCYRCKNIGHRSYEFPDNENVGQRGNYVAQGKQAEAQAPMVENAPEVEEALLMNKVLLKPEKEVVESSQRKALF